MSDSDQLMQWEGEYRATPDEQLTLQFYDWERRGRGWQVWSRPVELEPPFRPFLFHYVPQRPPVDDGRKPTFFSSLAEKLTGSRSNEAVDTDLSESLVDDESTEPEPDIFYDAPLVETQVTLPEGHKVNRETSERLLLNLATSSAPLSFEVIGRADSVFLQFACRQPDQTQLRQQLRGYFPDAIQIQEDGFLKKSWQEARATQSVIVDFGLSQEFMRPLSIFTNFDVDPLIGVVGALSDLEEDELGILQILFQAVRYPWAESILRAVTDGDGKAFFADAPEMVTLAKQKIGRPLFAAVIRVAAKSNSYDRAWQIARALGASLTQFSNPPSNEFIPLANDDYEEVSHETDLLARQSRRSGMLLNSEELVSLTHLPSVSVRSEKLKRQQKRTKAAPMLASGHRLVLGENTHGGKTSVVTLSPDQRIKHTYVIGASGTGKSTLLLNLIVQDIKNGEGVCVLDPHGDLIDQVLGYVPEERAADVVLVDPSDEEYPVGFNILSAHSELEKNLLSSDLVAVFHRLSTSWGDQMTSVLGNAILAFLESSKGGTLAELRRFLVEADFRTVFLKTVQDPEVVYFWQREFPLLTGKPQAPLLTRLDTFLRPKPIRHMVSQKENRLDFRTIINEGKILLVKLAQGAIGEENAYLFGTFLVSKLHQLAMSRQEVSESQRRNFYLYIDEFHNFITPSMASILSGARKYHLGLILAHQELRQLWSRDTEVASAVIANPYTRICFRLGDFDAKKLEEGFSFFGASDLQNLGIGEAICRIERSEYDFNLKTLPLPHVEPELAKQRRERLITLSREKYATRREEVEAQLATHRTIAEPSPVVREKPVKTKEETQSRRPKASTTEAELKTDITIPAPLGRGGQQHKYLQQLIKRMAESKGYHATIEKQILGGLGSVDVALEKDARSIACEISVSSTVEQEVGNIQKCLAAGFEQVILISSDKKTLSRANETLSAALNQEERARILFHTPEELFSFLEGLEAEQAGVEEKVRGYKVKVKFQSVSEAEKKTRKQAISQTILQALKRMKDRGGK